MINNKYTIKAVSILLSATLIYACNEKTEIPEYNYTSDRIVVKTEVEGQTKAGYEGTTALPSEFVMDIIQGNNQNYNYSLVRMTKEDTGNTYKSPEGTVLLWEDSDHSNTSVKAMTIPAGMTSVDAENPMKISVCTDQTTEDNIRKSDLLGAVSGEDIVIDGNDININFNHLMSKLYVTCKIQDELAEKSVSINSIHLENICIEGGFSYADMDYSSEIEGTSGNISMFFNSSENTAEGIFYPYIPQEDPVLVVKTTIKGVKKDFRCPISLKDPNGFLGGKRYKMTVRINGTKIENSTINAVKDWTEDSGRIESIADKKILWIGTSIPSAVEWFGIDNNYPKMIADAAGYDIVNNSRPGSFLCFEPVCTWTTSAELEAAFPLGYCLSATHKEVEDKYRPVLNDIKLKENLSQDWVDKWMNDFLGHSYESLIIPYIDGTLDDCSIIIIDHGYNDRHRTAYECLKNTIPGEIPVGKAWLESLINNTSAYTDTYKLDRLSYFVNMNKVIQKCYETRPDIKIIIGNYFASRTPVFATEFTEDIGGVMCGDLICLANEAIAAQWGLESVNVYKYTGIDNPTDFTQYYKFCPDGTHPGSDPSGQLNQMIAYIYIKELRRIFGGN